MVWVWRDTPACENNHDLSYARSKDLRNWETGAGKPVTLPMTISKADIVDPVPVLGGMINNNTIIGFDADKRVTVSYHKFDANGNTQIYTARLEDGKWKIYQTSDWQHRWDFRGGGTMIFELRLGPVRAGPDGTLTQWFEHVKYGKGTWKLDPATLKPTATMERDAGRPPELDKVESTFPEMQVKWQRDRGTGDEKDVSYWLRWETLPINRDRPRPEPWPEPSMLRLYKISSGG